MPCELPPGERVMGTKWVFELKVKANNSIKRCKTRLVALEYIQQEGIDYQETFSPVVRINGARILIALAAQKD